MENHWIWSNERYLKTWIWFLFRANHKPNKLLFSGELIELNRGEFITSLKHISEAANLTVQETRHFLKLLEKDSMILKNSNTLATKITICNYESYQDLQQTNNKPTTNEQQTNNKQTTTDNNVKNYKNEEEVYIQQIPLEFPEKTQIFITKKKRKLEGKRLESFLKFWDKFGYKKGKAEAADSWLDIPMLTNSLCDKIFISAELECKNRKLIEEKGQTPIMAQGWITARRWEDEILQPKQKQKNSW